jgi:2-polyprenyl-3-methyl-5-hydroxy-6-metoxy-1,4-benzoquinol methylase
VKSIITHTICPVCGATTIKKVLTAKDHTVSQREFEIWECSNCTLRFTQNIPGEQEIAAFYQSENYISHSDTSKGIVNRLYHMVRKRTLKSKRKLIESCSNRNSGNLLDIGAGTGAFLHHMQEHQWQVTGLEPDPAARERALSLYALNLLSPDHLFHIGEKSMDVITMWHVLEHVHRLHEYMEQLKKILQPGGLLFIAVPNYTSRDAASYGASWAAWDVPRHLYHFSPSSMEQLVKKHGLQLQAVKPMWFDSFYVSLLSEKYKTGKSSLIKGGFAGLLSNLSAMSDRRRCSSLIYIISTAT